MHKGGVLGNITLSIAAVHLTLTGRLQPGTAVPRVETTWLQGKQMRARTKPNVRRDSKRGRRIVAPARGSNRPQRLAVVETLVVAVEVER